MQYPRSPFKAVIVSRQEIPQATQNITQLNVFVGKVSDGSEGFELLMEVKKRDIYGRKSN
ncbi:hypothetical protein FRX31_026732 [Thalictrum thalictroides]|uniref:Uncharacterized protein n=1 Tax=Thalictrum thalictroides TaxID=46969 RepID=A0A7J6VHI8_THATH|nr:hypothetical protein FRX31_026732 [Thalictrum thalictroides]